MGIFISNILAGFFIVGSAFFVVWLVYYMQFHFTSVRTLPSMATLPTRSVVGILLSAIPVFVSVSYYLNSIQKSNKSCLTVTPQHFSYQVFTLYYSCGLAGSVSCLGVKSEFGSIKIPSIVV